MNFTALREQIPDDLLEPVGVAADGPARTGLFRRAVLAARAVQAYSLGFGMGRTRITAASTRPRPRSTSPTFKRNFPESIRDTSSRSPINWF